MSTIKELEDSIPDGKKNMSFGGDGEDVIDVMERSEKRSHHQGYHDEYEHPTCPLCNVE